MAEYIEKQAAIEAINSVPAGNWSSKRYAGELERIPPADVRPVIRGRWINEERVGFGSVEAECSNCGRRMIYNPAWRCCPWCMADMRGGDAK